MLSLQGRNSLMRLAIALVLLFSFLPQAFAAEKSRAEDSPNNVERVSVLFMQLRAVGDFDAARGRVVPATACGTPDRGVAAIPVAQPAEPAR